MISNHSQHCYYGLIGSHTRAFDWYQNRWPWATLKGVSKEWPKFLHLRYYLLHYAIISITGQRAVMLCGREGNRRRCTGHVSQTSVVYPPTGSTAMRGRWAPHLRSGGARSICPFLPLSQQRVKLRTSTFAYRPYIITLTGSIRTKAH